MRNMKKIVLILCLCYASLFSDIIESSKIDISKKGIALGTFVSLNRAKLLAKKFDAFDIYIKKTTTTAIPYYVVFAVNIPKELQKSTLKDIKKLIKSAYITSDRRIKELHNDNNSTKTNITKDIKPKKIVKQKKEKVTAKKVVKNKKIQKDNRSLKLQIDIKKKAISLKFVSTKKEVLKLFKKLSSYDVLAKKVLFSDDYIVYIVNIEERYFQSIFDKLKEDYPKAKETSKSRIKYFATHLTKDDIFQKKILNVTNKIFLDPILKAKYKKAKILFTNKQYKKSADILEELFKEDSNNVNINFYLGRSYYELKKYEKASAAFERAVIVDENNLRARVELAQTYLQLNLTDEALKNFNLVLQNNIPKVVRKNVLNKIKYIKNLKKKSFFSGIISAGITFDNNINNVSGGKTTGYRTVYGVLDITDTRERISDTYTNFNIAANHFYKLNDKLSLSNKVTFNTQKYSKRSEKDLDILAYNLSLSKAHEKSLVSGGIDLSKVILNSQDYFRTIGLTLGYQKSYFSNIRFFATVKYFDKSYYSEYRKNLDSRNLQFLFGNTYPTQQYGLISLIYLHETEHKKTPDILGANEHSSDKETHSIMLSDQYPLSNRLTLNSIFIINKINNESEEEGYATIQKDLTYNLTVGLQYKLTKTMLLNSSIKHIENHSTVNFFDYNKETIDFSIMKFF